MLGICILFGFSVMRFVIATHQESFSSWSQAGRLAERLQHSYRERKNRGVPVPAQAEALQTGAILLLVKALQPTITTFQFPRPRAVRCKLQKN